MPESTTAERTSDTRPTAETAPSAPIEASGPTVVGGPAGGSSGMTRDQLQQRFGNRGSARMLQQLGSESAENGASADGVGSGEQVGTGGEGDSAETVEAAEAEAAEADAAGAEAAGAEAAGAEAAGAEAAALSPFEATAPARRGVTRAATESADHPEAPEPVDAAQAAAVDADQEQARAAAEQTVTQINAVPEGGVAPEEQQGFEEQLRQALEKAIPIPESDDEAERVMDQGGEQASAALSGAVDGLATGAAGPLADASSDEAEVAPEEMPAPEEQDLTPESAGEPPRSVSGASVVPPPLPESQLDYSDHSADSDQAMAENDVTTEQLARGNEPQFNETLGARDEAEAHATEGATAVRENEAGIRAAAGARADDAIGGGLSEFHSTRISEVGSVAGTQESTRSENEAKRLEITNRVVAIKDATRADVEQILEDMTHGANDLFKDGLKAAERAYKRYFDDNIGGFSLFGFRIGGDTDRAFKAAREAYKVEVDKAIRAVVAHVEAKLAEAKRRVQEGKDEVDDYVAGLDEDLIRFGREAQKSVEGDFESLEGDIEAAKSGLIDSLVAQYRESQERVAAMEEQLRQENMSLWDRIYEATVGLVQKILEFKNMLIGVLARAGDVIGAIIDDPIGFLGNLIAGIMGGLNRFKDNIAEHLKAGLMGWLVGSLQGAGIELPTTFDLKGTFQLIFGILGVTYQFIRRKAVRLLGEETVSRLEQVAEIFVVLVNEGPAGVWRLFVEKLGDIKEMILGEIQEFVIGKIILAGITWLISLLNPASAFFKACKAIYDIVMFFINRGQQIMELVNAILDSIATIVAGNVAAMSQAVENVLARIIPVAISFLASLLGLGGISDKIRDIVGKIQGKVEEAIEWLVAKAMALARKAGGLFGGQSDRDQRGDVADDNDPEKASKIEAAMADVGRRGREAGPNPTRDDVVAIVDGVKADHPVLTSLDVEAADGSWDFYFRASRRRRGASLTRQPERLDIDVFQVLSQQLRELRTRILRWAEQRDASVPLDVGPWIRKLDERRELLGEIRGERLRAFQAAGGGPVPTLSPTEVDEARRLVDGVNGEFERAVELEADRRSPETVEEVSMEYLGGAGELDVVSRNPATGVRRYVEVKNRGLFTTGSNSWPDIEAQARRHIAYLQGEIAAGRLKDPILEFNYRRGVHATVKRALERMARNTEVSVVVVGDVVG